MAESYLHVVVGETALSTIHNWPGFTGQATYSNDILRLLLSHGDIAENILLECPSGQDAGIQTPADYSPPYGTASNWSIRNIGFKNINRRGSYFKLGIGDGSTSGNSLIENVFIDVRGQNINEFDACFDDTGYRGGISHSANSRGTVTIQNCFFAGAGDNATYWEQQREFWEEGEFHWKNCYFRDNNVSSFRTGHSDSSVTDSIFVANDPYGMRGAYQGNTHPGPGTTRGLWCRACGPVIVDNLHAYCHPDHLYVPSACNTSTGACIPVQLNNHSSSGNWPSIPPTVTVTNCRINQEWVNHRGQSANRSFYNQSGSGTINISGTEIGNPDVGVLGDGVPWTPEMAASGQRGYPPDPIGPSPWGGVDGEPPEPGEPALPPEDPSEPDEPMPDPEAHWTNFGDVPIGQIPPGWSIK